MTRIFRHLRLLLACLGGLLASPVSMALPPDRPVDARLAEHGPLSLTEYFATLEDRDRSLGLADVQKPDRAARFLAIPAGDALSFGYTQSAYWLRLTLRNVGDAPLVRLLEIRYALLSRLELHRVSADGSSRSLTTGLAEPYASRPYANRNFVFPLTLPPHSEETIYLRVQSSNSILIPARLWSVAAFHAFERDDYLTQAWYFGVATAMILFNLMLFVAIRDSIYLVYVVFAICMTLSLAMQNGLANEFLWQNAPYWSELALTTGYSFALSALLLFTRRMLDLTRHMPRLDRWLTLPQAFFLLSPLALVFAFETVIQPIYVVATVTLLLILGIGCARAWQRQRSAYFFVVAFLAFLCASTINALMLLGALPANGITANALQFGSVLEMLLLSFALADRFNEIRRENAEAQQRLVDTLKSSERQLEKLVAQRTAELQEKNQQLEQLAITDRLTGLFNRLKLDHVLDEEMQRFRRYANPFALVLLDIDHFKSVNDTFGHTVGDQVLVEVSRLIASVTREVDVCGRWGGEEFLIVCRDTALEGAVATAEKLRQLIAHSPFATGTSHTGSFGVAAACAGDTLASILARADTALYRAKAEGRNRVEHGS